MSERKPAPSACLRAGCSATEQELQDEYDEFYEDIWVEMCDKYGVCAAPYNCFASIVYCAAGMALWRK
jgi:hypothetical protein